MNFKKIESDIVPIYESETKAKLINARELHIALGSKRQFADWIKQRIKKYEFVENEDFITFHNFVKREGNLGSKVIEYYLTIDTAKEICMIENNHTGRKIRKYFIETEKRYREIIEKPTNIFDFMRLALDQIEENENKNNIQYKIIYERNTKNGVKGEIREQGYRIERVCYKVKKQ